MSVNFLGMREDLAVFSRRGVSRSMIHVLLSTFPFDNLLLHKLRRNSPGFVL